MQFCWRFRWIFAIFSNFRQFFDVAKNCPQILPELSQRHRKACKRLPTLQQTQRYSFGCSRCSLEEVSAKNWKYPEFETFRKVQKLDSRFWQNHPSTLGRPTKVALQSSRRVLIFFWAVCAVLVQIWANFRKISILGYLLKAPENFPESCQNPPSNLWGPTTAALHHNEHVAIKFLCFLSLSRVETCLCCQFLSVFWIARFGDSWYWSSFKLNLSLNLLPLSLLQPAPSGRRVRNFSPEPPGRSSWVFVWYSKKYLGIGFFGFTFDSYDRYDPTEPWLELSSHVGLA